MQATQRTETIKSSNILSLESYRRARADDELNAELSMTLKALLALEFDEFTPEAKAQALVHLFEAQKLLD